MRVKSWCQRGALVKGLAVLSMSVVALRVGILGCKKQVPVAPPESAAPATTSATVPTETSIALNDELRRTLFTSYHLSKGYPLEEGETDMSPESICMAKKVFASEAEYDVAKAQGFQVEDVDPVWVREKPTNLEPIFAHAGIGALDKERFRRFFRVQDLSDEDVAFVNAHKDALAVAFNATTEDSNFEENCAQLFADGRLFRAATVEADSEQAFQLQSGSQYIPFSWTKDKKYCAERLHNRCKKWATKRVYVTQRTGLTNRVRQARASAGNAYAKCLAYGGGEPCHERRSGASR